MRAIVIERPGGPEVLVEKELPRPEPGPDEVRVRIRATAVNRADLIQRMGFYPAPPDAPKDIPGLELAGEIDAVGGAVGRWRVGDRVLGIIGGGSYAEYAVTHADCLAALPAGLSFSDAAAIPEAFITAWDAVVSQGALATGETLLVHAVGSGVGSAAVQIGKALGARVLGTSRTAGKLDAAAPLGLEHGILVAAGRFAKEVLAATAGRGADVILELVGGNYLAEDIACAAPRGRLLLVGLVAGRQAELDLGRLLQQRLTLKGTQLRMRPLPEKIALHRLLAEELLPRFAQGALHPLVDRVLPLAAAAEAHRRLAENEGFGKLVLAVD